MRTEAFNLKLTLCITRETEPPLQCCSIFLIFYWSSQRQNIHTPSIQTQRIDLLCISFIKYFFIDWTNGLAHTMRNRTVNSIFCIPCSNQTLLIFSRIRAKRTFIYFLTCAAADLGHVAFLNHITVTFLRQPLRCTSFSCLLVVVLFV